MVVVGAIIAVVRERSAGVVKWRDDYSTFALRLVRPPMIPRETAPPSVEATRPPHQRVALAVVAFVLLLAILVMVPRVIDAAMHLFERRRTLEPRERALLALAAPYARIAGMDDVELAGLRPMRRQSVWNSLAREWGIRGRRTRKRELSRQALEWLQHVGNRGALPSASMAGQDGVPIARALLAWDCGRLVHLARLCFFAGYLDEADAWTYIRSAARHASSAFDSWNAYGQALLAGRALSLGSHDRTLAKAITALHSDPKSPWRRYPWIST